MTYDLKIVGGTIVDGSGSAGYRGDVGISDGRIVALGDAPDSAERTIDAEGAVVSPGFVDIHTHYDAQIIWDRMMSISPWHGVTTTVLGNCGFGVAPTRAAHRDMIIRTLEKVEGMSVPALQAGLGEDWPFETFGEYLDVIEARGSAINMAVLLGHTPLRMYVMGEAATERAATDDEIEEMRAIVKQGMKDGALGFATSRAGTHVGYEGRPVPSRACEIEEIFRLAKAVGESGGGLIAATAGKDLFIDEYPDLARTSGCTVTWTALLAGLALGKGDHEEQLAKSEAIVAEGHRVFPQVTPRPLNFEYQMAAPFLFEPFSVMKPAAAADAEGKKKIYADPEFREAFRARIDGARKEFKGAFDKTVISQHKKNGGLDEKVLADVARERGMTPTDLLLDLALETDLETRFRMPVANHNEDEVEPLLKSGATVIGLSDAGAHASQLCDACQPTYFLGRWVREKQTFTIEEAVRMLTSRPAEVAGITDRGLLAEGRPADIAVFDPETVGAGGLERVYDFPGGADRLISKERGMRAVVVNGTVLRENGADAISPEGNLPGGVLRNGRAA
ncbi:MAG: amidohydrolase family protein [Alphaproteobacteria bacterium]|jgi:N-acyl-D-amino-acid deacylase|nr:amidohydrolase family protein [Alphaproteobacteria bacterium]